MILQKATLSSPKGEADTVVFMFNPTELKFKQSSGINKDGSARTEKGYPKLSFSQPEPRTLDISNIIFDTYESGQSVLKVYIQKLEQGVRFATRGEGKDKRPPVYVFSWGAQKYMQCFIKSLSWDLTMFNSVGIPVRAKVTLSLEEVDESQLKPDLGTPSGSESRTTDTRSSRS
jgi:hypothetical protein